MWDWVVYDFFFLVPLVMRDNNIIHSDLWKIYLPMLLLGALTMVPAAFIAESRNRYKEVMMFGTFVLMFSVILFTISINSNFPFYWFLTAVFLFFMGFNVFEPILPSLVSKFSSSQTKGTATGVYNFFQFFGHFFGSFLAGMFYKEKFEWILLILFLLELIFLYYTINFRNPGKFASKIKSDTANAITS